MPEVVMPQVNIHHAKTHLSELIAAAERGEEVVIARANRPALRLVPVSAQKTARTPGLHRGAMRMSEDFDAPLPDVFWGFSANA
jgi:prevent-host-death family protein